MADVLHYRGDHRNFDPDHIMGPDMYGAYYVAVASDYNADNDVTTLRLRPLAPKELAERRPIL